MFRHPHNSDWVHFPKLSYACSAIRPVTPLITSDTYILLRLVYFAHFHSTVSYGVIFCENSTGNKECTIHKRKLFEECQV